MSLLAKQTSDLVMEPAGWTAAIYGTRSDKCFEWAGPTTPGYIVAMMLLEVSPSGIG